MNMYEPWITSSVGSLKFPSSSKYLCSAAIATPTLISFPVSQAIQTRIPWARCSWIKCIERGRMVCKKWAWPFFPSNVMRKSKFWSVSSAYFCCSRCEMMRKAMSSDPVLSLIDNFPCEFATRSPVEQSSIRPATIAEGQRARVCSRDSETHEAIILSNSDRSADSMRSQCVQKILGVNPIPQSSWSSPEPWIYAKPPLRRSNPSCAWCEADTHIIDKKLFFSSENFGNDVEDGVIQIFKNCC